MPKMVIARRRGWLFVALSLSLGVLVDCGADGPTFSLSVEALSFHAATTCRTPVQQLVTGTVSGVTRGTLYVTIVSTGVAVASVSDFTVTSQTTGVAGVVPASADILGPGTFTSTISVRACLDDPSCTTGELSGSPKTIKVTYQIDAIGISDAPAAYTITEWQATTASAPNLSDYHLGAIGNTLYVIGSGFYSHVMETWASTDLGTTWKMLTGVGPATAVKDFGVASAPTAVFLSGGTGASGAQTNEVWKFDGVTWTQATAAAAFPARDKHAMIWHESKLYVLGGRAGIAPLNDVWASQDQGATWTSVATSSFTGGGYDLCAVSWRGSIYVLAGQSAAPVDVWRSVDGAVWQGLGNSGTSPLQDLLFSSRTRCGIASDRLYYVGSSPTSKCFAGSVSSANGLDWQFEPSPFDPSPGSNAVSMNGHIFLTGEAGLSVRLIYRSLP